jgi:hypothetical protein
VRFKQLPAKLILSESNRVGQFRNGVSVILEVNPGGFPNKRR